MARTTCDYIDTGVVRPASHGRRDIALKSDSGGPVVFLRDFIRDFSADVKRSGNPFVEYVPTQLVTEYFKEVYESIFHDHVDGIVYPSSKNPGHNACVLFLDHPTSLKAMDMVSLDIL